MKKAVLIVVLLLTALLCGCNKEEQINMESTNKGTITVINSVNDADIWILPQTEKNLKTTVWGTATVSKIKKGEGCKASLCKPGDNGLYLFRMIDTGSFYYSANGISLEDGWTVEIKETDTANYTLEVSDENGKAQNTYEVFSARL